ncbi:hypothetical protein CEXT_804361 [Caerostris extrusa]|uniref:Uncharacterized protein n=1 Tax=Caerostris extrusa TaxID=172846 RepID=A0AAV4TXZ7_CAEEX|nr:hypothetical protein CEXT_804361 [Caerostris extrusa]
MEVLPAYGLIVSMPGIRMRGFCPMAGCPKGLVGFPKISQAIHLVIPTYEVYEVDSSSEFQREKGDRIAHACSSSKGHSEIDPL